MGTRNLLLDALTGGLTSALLAFVFFLVFALEHPFVGELSVQPTAYANVLEAWAD